MKYVTEVIVNAPAIAAWTVLGERFGALESWTSTIAHTTLDGELQVGVARTCESTQQFGPFPPATVTERLTLFDREQMEFRYEATQGIPRFVKHATNHWRIEPIGTDRCRVTSTAEVRFTWWATVLAPLFPAMIRGDMHKLSEELRVAIEAEASRGSSCRAA